MIDTLLQKIEACGNPTAVGLDTHFDYLPDEMKKSCKTPEDAAKAITEFNYTLIDRLHKYVPAVKVQVAYYEMYGVAGMQAFCDTLRAAKAAGLVTIADCKRNDIGSTAACYSAAYLGRVRIGEKEFEPFPADFLTVNGYLGTDGLDPFIADCRKYDKGIFALVKTSNPSGGQLQDKEMKEGGTLYENMARLVCDAGKELTGKYGYSDVGAVIGATHPKQAEDVRKKFPHLFFLIPGYGAQGGSADALTVCFDAQGRGGIVNNSRGIICAYRNEKYRGQSYAQAAENAVLAMREDIAAALAKAGKPLKTAK